MLEGYLEGAASAGRQRQRSRNEHRAPLSQSDLIQFVEELDGHFYTEERSVAIISQLTSKSIDFLV